MSPRLTRAAAWALALILGGALQYDGNQVMAQAVFLAILIDGHRSAHRKEPTV